MLSILLKALFCFLHFRRAIRGSFVIFLLLSSVHVQAAANDGLPKNYNAEVAELVIALDEGMATHVEFIGEAAYNAFLKDKILNTLIAKSMLHARDLMTKYGIIHSVDIQKIALAFKNGSFLPKKSTLMPSGSDLITFAIDLSAEYAIQLFVVENELLCDSGCGYFKNRQVVEWLVRMAYIDIKGLVDSKAHPTLAKRDVIVGNAYILADIAAADIEQAFIARDAVGEAKKSEAKNNIFNLYLTYQKLYSTAFTVNVKEQHLSTFETECNKYASWSQTFHLFRIFGDPGVAVEVKGECADRVREMKEFERTKRQHFERNIEFGVFEHIAAKKYIESYFPLIEHTELLEYCNIYCPDSPFIDVKVGDIYYKATKWSYENRLVNGFQNTLEYRSKELASVGQVFLVISRYISLDSEVPSNDGELLQTYKEYLKNVKNILIPSQLAALTSDRYITREEYASLLYAVLTYYLELNVILTPEHTLSISDGYDGFSLLSVMQISVIVEREIMKTFQRNYLDQSVVFKPTDGVGRGEMVDVVSNLHQHLQSIGVKRR